MDLPQAIYIGICVGMFLLNTFRVQKAIEICNECLILLKHKAVGKKKFVQIVRLLVYKMMAFASSCLLDYKSGIRYGEKVLLICRDLGERADSRLILMLAVLYQRETNYADAESYYRKAIELMDTADLEGKSNAYVNLGTLLVSIGKLDEAKEYLEKALLINKQIGDRNGERLSCERLGTIYESISQYDKAEDFFKKALAIAKEIGHRQGEGTALANLGTVFVCRGEYDMAKNYLDKALAIMTKIGDKKGQAAVYGSLGNVFQSLGEHFMAKTHLEKALSIMPREKDNMNEKSSLCGSLGTVFTCLGEYENAKKYLEKSLAICKEIGQRSGEATSYANLGSLFQSLGENDKALEYYEKALAMNEEIGDRKSEARDCGNLGSLYHALGKYDKAKEFCKKSLVITKEIGDRKGEGRAYGNLGSVYHSLGDYPKAKECLEYALMIFCQLGDIRSEAASYTNLGALFESQSEYRKAKEYIEKTLPITVKIGDRKGEASAYANLGAMFHHLSDYTKAEEYFKIALRISVQLGDKQGEAAAYGNLGVLFISFDDYVKAVEHLEKALAIVEENGDRQREGTIHVNLGEAFHSLGEYAKCKEHSEKGLAIMTEISDRKGVAASYSNLGTVLQYLDEIGKAKEYHEKALVIRKEIGDRNGEAHSYGGLGTVLLSLKEYRKATEHFKRALAISKEIGDRKGEAAYCGYLGDVFLSLGEYNKALEYQDKKLAISTENGDTKQQLECNCSLAKVKVLQGRSQEAVDHLVTSIQRCEDIRGFLKHNDQFKISLLEKHVSPYHLLSGLYCAAGNLHEALRVIELGRARALADLMTSQYFGKQISFFPQSLDGIERIMKNESNCTCLYIYVFEDVIFVWILTATRFAFRQVRVKENRSYVGPVKTFNDLFAKFKRVAKSTQEDCEDRSLHHVNERQAAVNSLQEGDKAYLRIVEDDKEEIPERSLSLIYKLIIRPVADLLEEPEIVIVPDRLLYNVPFAALQDESGKYLSETFKIRIVPSLTTLKLIRDSPADYHSQTDALIVGDPEVGQVTYKGRLEWISPLPCARKEAEMIGRLVGAQPLIGKNATKQAVLDRINSVSLIHFAAHGNAERGEIALAPLLAVDVIPQEEDYLLTMSDISQARLRTKLVVLSCCHSASGQVKVEGVVGIARAFLGSGARSVLVALWAIQDNATEQLMSRFYEHLVRGESASESLHQAMKWMRSNGYSDVGQWAPFMLIGDNVTFHFGH